MSKTLAILFLSWAAADAQSRIPLGSIERISDALGVTQQLQFYRETAGGGQVIVIPIPRGDSRVVWTDRSQGLVREAIITKRSGDLVLFGSQIVFSRLRPAMDVWALDLQSGEEKPLGLSMHGFLMASLGERLAIVGTDSRNVVQLVMLDSQLTPQFSRPIQSMTWSDVDRGMLCWVSGERLAVVDRSSASYVTIDPGTGNTSAKTVLRGEEINTYRAQVRPPTDGVFTVLLHAHLRAKNGNDLFFLGSYKPSDGYRLVEFDANGVQQASYILELSNDTGGATSFGSRTVLTTYASIDVVSSMGVRQRYGRP